MYLNLLQYEQSLAKEKIFMRPDLILLLLILEKISSPLTMSLKFETCLTRIFNESYWDSFDLENFTDCGAGRRSKMLYHLWKEKLWERGTPELKLKEFESRNCTKNLQIRKRRKLRRRVYCTANYISRVFWEL